MTGHDVTEEQWQGLAEVVPLRGNEWPSWPGHEALGGGRDLEEVGQRQFVVIRCQCFADARRVAEYLIAQVPVLLDLTVADHDVAKRVLDFASGVTFGIRSSMHRVDKNVFLLAPVGTEVELAAGR